MLQLDNYPKVKRTKKNRRHQKIVRLVYVGLWVTLGHSDCYTLNTVFECCTIPLVSHPVFAFWIMTSDICCLFRFLMAAPFNAEQRC